LQQEAFGQSFLPVAYLLEGEFSSLYKNRILPRNVKSENFLEKGRSKILICSDWDLVSNEVNSRNNQPYDLGYDPFSQYTFSNKEFVTNALEYLLDEKGLIVARTKEIKIRPLDKFKVENERVFWQIINLVAPVVLILIFGISRYFIRKKKYANY